MTLLCNTQASVLTPGTIAKPRHDVAGSHEAEVSTGAHPGRAQPPPVQSPCLHGRQCAAEQAASEHEAASSLAELAAAADSGGAVQGILI